MMEGKCERCGVAFLKPSRGKPYRFCSRACGVWGRGGPSRKIGLVINCKTCGKATDAKPKEDRVYCSNECRYKGRDVDGEKNPNFRNAGWHLCVGCGARFHSYQKTRDYCTPECSWKHSSNWGHANQRRGYDAELKAMHELDSRGYFAFRTARSRGPFDVFGLGKEGALCVQVKRTKEEARRWQKAELEKMLKFREGQRDTNRMLLWCWVDGKDWFVREIYKDGSVKDGWGLDWLGLSPVVQQKLDLMRDV